MPENTPDPIEQLQSLRGGGPAVNPLPAEEVRRRGDRRRRTRRAVVSVAAAAAVVAAVVPVALLAGDDGTAGGSTPQVLSTTSPSPTPSDTITYPGDGVYVTDPAQVDEKLVGTSPEFRAFIADRVRAAIAYGQQCPDAAHGVTVFAYSSRGYARGAYNDCSGGVELWAQIDDVWQLGDGGQDTWDCETLAYLGIPRDFVDGECFDESGGFGPDEVDGISLGMTEQQVRAAGGTITDSPGGESCRGLLLPYHQPVENRTDGVFGENRGVVAIFARSGEKTPERVGLGTPLSKLRTVYPDARRGQNGYWVLTVPGQSEPTEYQFGIQADDTVGEMLLTRSDQECFG